MSDEILFERKLESGVVVRVVAGQGIAVQIPTNDVLPVYPEEWRRFLGDEGAAEFADAMRDALDAA